MIPKALGGEEAPLREVAEICMLLAQASHDTIGTVLAFSAAALLYLVTEELLMEAHEVEEKPFFTLVLFAGFLVFWAIQLFGQG